MNSGKFVSEDDQLVYSLCIQCKHWPGYKGKSCKAFPDGIPEEIMIMAIDHRKPYKGDNGIQFEPVKE